MVPSAEIEVKKAIAKEVVFQLSGIFTPGSTILDVGFGLGYNAAALRELDATIFGVEPDKAAFTWAVEEKNIDKANAFCGKLQDMPENFVGQVDLATVLLWNVARAEYKEVLETLSRKIRPEGMAIIGMHDEVYISDPYGGRVKPHAECYFDSVREVIFEDMCNRHLLICMKPKRVRIQTRTTKEA